MSNLFDTFWQYNSFSDAYLYDCEQTVEAELNSPIEFIKTKIQELDTIYRSLFFEHDAILQIGRDIIQECAKIGKTEIFISKTGESELLIYTNRDGVFNNIIIDKDADIEYVHIPLNRTGTYNKHIYFTDNIDIQDLVSKL
jgi:hypothetical protein